MKAFILSALLISATASAEQQMVYLRMGYSSVHTCIDSDGVKHMFSARPEANSGMLNCEVKRLEYPIYGIPGTSATFLCSDTNKEGNSSGGERVQNCTEITNQKSDWVFLGRYGSHAFSVKRASLGKGEVINKPNLWYKVEYPTTELNKDSEMFLISVSCSTSQIEYMQTVTYFRNRNPETLASSYKRYAVPDSSDEALVKFACPKK